MRRLSILAFVLVAVAGSAAAAPWEKAVGVDWTKPPAAAAADTRWKPPVPVRLKLANGMSLLVIENHALPLFSAELVIPGAGVAADPDGQAGLAQLTADLLDESAGGLGALELADQIDRLGASIEPYAGRDVATISVSGLVKTIDPTLGLLAKILTSPTFDEKEAARVHEDRATNLKLRRDRPREIAAMLLDNTIWGRDTAYGHPGAGYMKTFQGLTAADAKAFYETHYDPASMTLVVAGDVDAKELQGKLDGTIGAWKNAKAKKAKAPKVAAQKIGKRLVIVDREGAEQSDVRIGIVGIKETDKRYPASEVLDTVLGGSFTSRLNHRLREELGYTYGIRAGERYGHDAGMFQISTALVTAHTDEGLAEILTIVGDLTAKAIPADELDKAKQNLIRQLPQQFGSNAAIAGTFAGLVTDGLPDDFYQSYAARIQKVTAKDVKALAAQLIPSKSLVFVIVGDLKAIKDGLDPLKLGDAAMYDLDGEPIR